VDGTKVIKAVLLTAVLAFGYASASDIFVQNQSKHLDDYLADLAKHPLPKETIRRVNQINACWDAVNKSPRFAELQNRLWLATTADQPLTPPQLGDRGRATPADSEAAMAWLEQTRPCSDWGPKKRAGDIVMLAYIANRRSLINNFTKGLSYGQVNQYMYVATRYFEMQFRAQSQRPEH
jgi:hypothetical protein